MAIIKVITGGGNQSSVSTETRQHPLAEESTVFSMQMRFVTTKVTTEVEELRGISDDDFDETDYVSSTDITDENNYKATSYTWSKLGDACIWTVTKTVVTTVITRSGWFNVTGT